MIMLTTSEKPLIPRDLPESDNANYVGQTSHFAWALANPDVVARFWKYVRQTNTDACWLWLSNCTGHGNKTHSFNSKHGQFTYTFQKKQYHVFAHRFAYALKHGVIAEGVKILHRCDCPPCCNERHLFTGTVGDNMRDAASKNRLTVPRDRQLSLFDRLTIYHTPAYRGIVSDLSKQYHVSKTCISLIRRGRFLGSGVWAGTKDVRRSA